MLEQEQKAKIGIAKREYNNMLQNQIREKQRYVDFTAEEEGTILYSFSLSAPPTTQTSQLVRWRERVVFPLSAQLKCCLVVPR